jgi:hypothetical protein
MTFKTNFPLEKNDFFKNWNPIFFETVFKFSFGSLSFFCPTWSQMKCLKGHAIDLQEAFHGHEDREKMNGRTDGRTETGMKNCG